MSLGIIKPTIPVLILLCLFFLLFSLDRQYDWDESNFVYKARYDSFSNPSEWFFPQGSKGYGWYRSKIGHLYLLHGLTQICGEGIVGRTCIDIFLALMMLGTWGFSYLIFKEIQGNKQWAFPASLFVLFSPISLWLSGKAVGETTALFFGVFSIWLFLLGTKSNNLSRWGWYLLSGLMFMAATTCRLEIFILFGGFATGLLFSGYKKVKDMFLSYIEVSAIFVSVVLLYFIITGINPYAFVMGGAVNYNPTHSAMRNIYLTGASQGLFGILILFSLVRWKDKIFHFAAIFLIITIIPFLYMIDNIVARYYYMSIIPAGILSYFGFVKLTGWLHLNDAGTNKQWIITILFIALAMGNIYLAQPLYITGIDGKPLNVVMKSLSRTYEKPLVLVDSAPNVYSYLSFTYPAIDIGLTRDHTYPYPNRIPNLQSMSERLHRQPVIYLCAYGGQATWVQRVIELVKGEKPVPSRRKWPNWIQESPELQYREIARQGQYTAYLITSSAAGK